MHREDEIQELRDRLNQLFIEASRIRRRLDDLADQGIPAARAVPPPIPPSALRPKEEAREDRPASPEIVYPEPQAASESVQPEPAGPPPIPSTVPGISIEAPRPLPPEMHRPVLARLLDRMREASGLDRETGWEMLLGKYWLSRIGILFLVMAIVFFLLTAAKTWGHYWTPPMRVATGYAVCAGLLVLAWRLEKGYRAYARVLYAGGFALSYFVTFATHYLPFARIFERQEPTLALLALVVAVWAAAAQWRRSRTLAVLVTFLGHVTVGLSLVLLERVTATTISGLVVLAAGSAFFLLRNRWYYVASVGIVGSYLNVLLWFLRHPGIGEQAGFWAGMSVLVLLLGTFACAELCAPQSIRRKQVPTWFRTLFVTANTASFFGLATLLIHGYEPALVHQDLFRFAYAAVLLALGIGYLRFRARDPLFNVYLTKTVVVVTLGLSARFSGHSLTAWMAVETVVLLFSARRSSLAVSRVLAFAVAVVTFMHGVDHLRHDGPIFYGHPDYVKRAVENGITVAALLAASVLYQRTKWTARALSAGWKNERWQEFLWQMDLLPEDPETGGKDRPLGGLLFPYLYAAAGGLLLVPAAAFLAEAGHRGAVEAAAALVILGVALLVDSRPLGAVSLALCGCVPIFRCADMLKPEVGGSFALGAFCAGALAVAALCSERGFWKGRDALVFHRLRPIPYALYGAAAWLTGVVLVREFSFPVETIALMVAAAAMAGLVALLHPRALAAAAVGLAFWAGARWSVKHASIMGMWGHASAWTIILGALAGERHFHLLRDRLRAAFFGGCLLFLAWALALWYGFDAVPSGWGCGASAAVGLGLLGWAVIIRSKTAGALSVVGCLFTSPLAVTISHSRTVGLWPLVAGFGGLVLFWGICERLASIQESRTGRQEYGRGAGGAVALATVLLVIFVKRLPVLPTHFLTVGWTILALVLFGFSLLFHQRFYRYAGLAVFLIALVRAVLVDAFRLEGFSRVGAYAALGLALLGVAWGYFKAMEFIRARDRTAPPSEPAGE